MCQKIYLFLFSKIIKFRDFFILIILLKKCYKNNILKNTILLKSSLKKITYHLFKMGF